MVFYFSSFIGLYILIISTCIGIIPNVVNVKRSHSMGVLLLPVILFFILWLFDIIRSQLFVQLSSEDYKNNRDPLLDEIFKATKIKFLINPNEYLKQLIESNSRKRAITLITGMTNDHSYRFINFEKIINFIIKIVIYH